MSYFSLFGAAFLYLTGGASGGPAYYDDPYMMEGDYFYLPAGIEVEIEEPETVNIDDEFDVVVTVINNEDETYYLEAFEFIQDYLNGVEILSISQDNSLSSFSDDYWQIYEFENLELAPGSELELVIDAKAIEGGSYYGGFDILIGDGEGDFSSDYYFAQLSTDIYVDGQLPENPFIDEYDYYGDYNYDYVRQNVEVNVLAPTKILSVGETFEFTVNIDNPGDKDAQLDTIDISSRFLEKGIEILSVNPVENGEYNYDEGVSYEYYETVLAGSEVDYTFTAKANESGNHSAYLDVCLDACFYEAVGVIVE